LAKGQKILDSTDGQIKAPPSVELRVVGFIAYSAPLLI
jgi:hypothetical protein